MWNATHLPVAAAVVVSCEMIWSRDLKLQVKNPPPAAIYRTANELESLMFTFLYLHLKMIFFSKIQILERFATNNNQFYFKLVYGIACVLTLPRILSSKINYSVLLNMYCK